MLCCCQGAKWISILTVALSAPVLPALHVSLRSEIRLQIDLVSLPLRDWSAVIICFRSEPDCRRTVKSLFVLEVCAKLDDMVRGLYQTHGCFAKEKSSLHFREDIHTIKQFEACVAASCIKHICDCSCSFKSNRVWRQTLKFKMPLCDLVRRNVYSDWLGVISTVSGYLNPVFKLFQKHSWILNTSSWVLSLHSHCNVLQSLLCFMLYIFIYSFSFWTSLSSWLLFICCFSSLGSLFKKDLFIWSVIWLPSRQHQETSHCLKFIGVCIMIKYLTQIVWWPAWLSENWVRLRLPSITQYFCKLMFDQHGPPPTFPLITSHLK